MDLPVTMDAASCRRIDFSSSVTIYDEAQYRPFDEGHPTAPTNLYGLTKAMTEGMSRGWIATRAQHIGSAARIFQPGGRA